MTKTKKLLYLTILLLTLWLTYVYAIHDNIHTVVPNQVYRSAELSEQGFLALIQKHNIRSIINLRGAWPGDQWYEAEMRAVKASEIKHYDLKLNPHKLPSKKELATLIEILQNAPKPLLIHCKSGADRTGMAAAISLILAGEQDLETIKSAYSVWYLAISPTSVGKQLLPRYENWLAKQNHRHSKQLFQQWAQHHYQPA